MPYVAAVTMDDLKHHLADPALAAVLLRATPEILSKGQGRWLGSRGSLVGGLFENLAMLTVRGTAQVSGADVFHLRTKRGEQEVDLIVEGQDGRIVAFEIKLDRAASDRDVKHLLWLRRNWGTRWPTWCCSTPANTPTGAPTGWPWFPWPFWVPEVAHTRRRFAGPIRGLLALFTFACAVRPANVNKASK